MSSLAALFNSCSTLFTVDIYQKIRPEASQRQLVSAGRMATAIVVLLGILWIPVMVGISVVLSKYLQSLQSYLAPPIAVVFMLDFFSKRLRSEKHTTEFQ